MRPVRTLLGLLIAIWLMSAQPAHAQSDASLYPIMPADPTAKVVKGVGDGLADDSDAIQAAVDEARDATGHGIALLPAGRYRITKTIVVPAGVRLYGFGATRPVVLLAPRTKGFASGVSTMFVFAGGDQYQVGKVPVPVPTIVPRDRIVRDANSGTFYSSMANIDIEIGKGNPAAAGVRFRMAQHAFLSHMDFRIGSGFAGVYQAGNMMDHLRFFGGRFGIVTEKTSPAWQFTLLDSQFSGQRDAAIREHEVDLTLVNVSIRDTPVGISIDEGYSDSLWAKNLRLENVSKAGVIISSEQSAFTQIGFDNALAVNVPVFARFRERGKVVPGKGAAYRVASFTHGLAVPGIGQMGATKTESDIEALPAGLPALASDALRSLPAMLDWGNVKTLGVTGDGQSDDTAAIQRAVDAHRILYFPVGFYRVSDTIKLRPDSVLIGLHPAITQLFIADGDLGYAGVGAVRPILETPRGGDNIVSGLGLFTGRVNQRASSLLWRSGAQSLLTDVKIMGGGGTPTPDGKPLSVPRGGGDPVADAGLDAQYPSIWVTDGGGGTFANVWSPQSYASAGFYVSDTDTPGHVYEMSVEHHARNEIVLDNVRNWEFLAPQTEQEVADGPNAVSLEIRNSSNLLFANYHAYRVTRSYHPARSAARLYNSSDIRFRNVHVNAESGYAACDDEGCGTFLRAGKYPFENAIEEMTSGGVVREREFATLDIGKGAAPASAPGAGLPVEKLTDGFWSIGGGAVDAKGALYFIDRRFQRIHRWSGERGLEIVRDHALDPINLAIDASGHLLVLSSLGAKGAVYSIDPQGPKDALTMIAATPVARDPAKRSLLPVNWWVNGEFRDQYDSKRDRFRTMAELFQDAVGERKDREYRSPDGSIALPAFRVWQQGPTSHLGWRWSHGLNANGFLADREGAHLFVTNASENITYRATVGPAGTLTALKPFAGRGGESVVVAPDGRVFVANGQIFVYGPDGRESGRIDVPDRPLQLVFGGADGRTLFILTHHALYRARP